VTETAAMERLLERLLAAPWGDVDAEERHKMSRARLANEFLRRTALWGDVLKAKGDWPFLKLAEAFDPSVPDAGVWFERLSSGTERGLGSATEDVVPVMFQWAGLGERPYQRFPELEDPYEPMLLFFERGGGIVTMHGAFEIYTTSVRFETRAERKSQTPFAIDPATLDALDEAERQRLAAQRVKVEAQRAGRRSQPD
jgi:hypothetical protein